MSWLSGLWATLSISGGVAAFDASHGRFIYGQLFFQGNAQIGGLKHTACSLYALNPKGTDPYSAWGPRW